MPGSRQQIFLPLALLRQSLLRLGKQYKYPIEVGSSVGRQLVDGKFAWEATFRKKISGLVAIFGR
jgi:hypothetical protein